LTLPVTAASSSLASSGGPGDPNNPYFTASPMA
jgi:hypothetical protein